jgi:hypothetical protein
LLAAVAVAFVMPVVAAQAATWKAQLALHLAHTAWLLVLVGLGASPIRHEGATDQTRLRYLLWRLAVAVADSLSLQALVVAR